MDQSILLENGKLDPLAFFKNLWNTDGITYIIFSFLEFRELLILRMSSKLLLPAVANMGQHFAYRLLQLPQLTKMIPRFVITSKMFHFVRQETKNLKGLQVSYILIPKSNQREGFPTWVTHFCSGFSNGICRRYSGRYTLEQRAKVAGLREVTRTSSEIIYEFDEKGIKQRIFRKFVEKFWPRSSIGSQTWESWLAKSIVSNCDYSITVIMICNQLSITQ